MKPGPHELAKHLPRNAPKERPHPAKRDADTKQLALTFGTLLSSQRSNAHPKAFRPSQGQPDEHYPNIASGSTRDNHRFPTTKRNACSATPSPEPILRIFATRLQPGTAGHPAACPDLRRQQRESYGQPTSKSNVQFRAVRCQIGADQPIDHGALRAQCANGAFVITGTFADPPMLVVRIPIARPSCAFPLAPRRVGGERLRNSGAPSLSARPLRDPNSSA